MTKVATAAIVVLACSTFASAQEFAWITEQITELTDLRRAREQQLEEIRIKVRKAERSQGKATAAWAGCRRGTDSMKPDVAILDSGRKAAEDFRSKAEDYRPYSGIKQRPNSAKYSVY